MYGKNDAFEKGVDSTVSKLEQQKKYIEERISQGDTSIETREELKEVIESLEKAISFKYDRD